MSQQEEENDNRELNGARVNRRCTHTHIYVHKHRYICTYTDTHTYTDKCLKIDTHTHMHAHAHARTRAHITGGRVNPSWSTGSETVRARAGYRFFPCHTKQQQSHSDVIIGADCVGTSRRAWLKYVAATRLHHWLSQPASSGDHVALVGH